MKTKLFSLFISLTLFNSAFCPAEEKVPYTQANTTIAFDIDNVLLERNEPISTTLWTYRWDLAKNILRPTLIYHVACLLSKSATGRAYLDLFKIKAPRLAEMVEHITLDKKPIENIEKLVKDLHTLSYQLVIASNMSAQDFAFYKEKFPTLFNNFDYAKVVPYDAEGKALDKKKPSLEYFKKLKEELADKGMIREHMIFIDDRKDNVVASRTEGFYGIIFKNPAQLQVELQELGIL